MDHKDYTPPQGRNYAWTPGGGGAMAPRPNEKKGNI